MDTASFHIKTLFYQGSYKAAIAEATSQPSTPLSDVAVRVRQLYLARSYIALHDVESALALPILTSDEQPDALAVKALAGYVAAADKGAEADDEELNEHVEDLRGLVEVVESDNAEVVRTCAGTVLHLSGQTEEALKVLGVGQNSKELECIALAVQILLSINRLDLAVQEHAAARTWADDSLLIQLIEAWIGLKEGGQKYQQAYYVFDEIAQLPSASNPAILNGKAVAHAAQGHIDEAEGALDEALTLDPNYTPVLSNKVALARHASKPADVEVFLSRLRTSAPHHPVLADLEAKSFLFDESAANFALAA